jgi:hypothetical protein
MDDEDRKKLAEEEKEWIEESKRLLGFRDVKKFFLFILIKYERNSDPKLNLRKQTPSQNQRLVMLNEDEISSFYLNILVLSYFFKFRFYRFKN